MCWLHAMAYVAWNLHLKLESGGGDLGLDFRAVAPKTWRTTASIQSGVVLLILVVTLAAVGTVVLQRSATESDEMQSAYSPKEQNRSVTPGFIRWVRGKAIQMIETRRSTVLSQVRRRAVGRGQQLAKVNVDAWNGMMGRLSTRWSGKLEADAVACQYRMAKDQQASRHPLPEHKAESTPGTSNRLISSTSPAWRKAPLMCPPPSSSNLRIPKCSRSRFTAWTRSTEDSPDTTYEMFFSRSIAR